MTRIPNKHKAASLVVLAGLFTGGEVLVNLGIELPGFEDIPGWVRAVAILGVSVGAAYFRWRASKE